jgi:hypothetical protein
VRTDKVEPVNVSFLPENASEKIIHIELPVVRAFLFLCQWRIPLNFATQPAAFLPSLPVEAATGRLGLG